MRVKKTVRKTELLEKAWQCIEKMHTTRWKPDEFVKELCCLAHEHHKKEKMVALAKEFIDICVEHNYMKKISLLLLGLSKNLKDVNSLTEILVYCGKLSLRDRLQFRLDSYVDTFNDRNVGKKIEVYTLDHLWFNLHGNELEPVSGCAIHPKSLIERETLLRYIKENWPTACRCSYKTFRERFPNLIEHRQLLKFLYCKYYCNRLRPKSVIVYFESTRSTYKKVLGFNYRLVSHCGKYVIYQRSKLTKNGYFELHHNNQVSFLSEEDREILEL